MNVKIDILDAKLVKMTDAEYFSSKYEDYISNSRLGLINPDEGGSIQAFFDGFSRNRYVASFEVGSAVHALVLQPESYFLSNADLPDGKLGLFARELHELGFKDRDIPDEAISELIGRFGWFGTNPTQEKVNKIRYNCSKFLEQTADEDVPEGMIPIYLSSKQAIVVHEAIKGLKENLDIARLMSCRDSEDGDTSCFNEHAVFAKARITVDGKTTILKLKSKLDKFIVDGDKFDIIDLKTSSFGPDHFQESMKRFHYHRQAAFYKMMLEALYSTDGLSFGSFNFVIVSTYDFTTGTYKVGKAELEKGVDELHWLMGLAALAIMDKNYRRDFKKYSTSQLAIGFVDRMKMISLLCYLLQAFRKKDPAFTPRMLLEKIRKDKITQNSERMLENLELWMEEFYAGGGSFPTFKFQKAKDMSAFINEMLDKEMPFSAGEEDPSDLPF